MSLKNRKILIIGIVNKIPPISEGRTRIKPQEKPNKIELPPSGSSDEFKKGYWAGYKNRKIENCPFSFGFQTKRQEWFKGFIEGKKQRIYSHQKT